jgi:hypothetical protein
MKHESSSAAGTTLRHVRVRFTTHRPLGYRRSPVAKSPADLSWVTDLILIHGHTHPTYAAAVNTCYTSLDHNSLPRRIWSDSFIVPTEAKTTTPEPSGFWRFRLPNRQHGQLRQRRLGSQRRECTCFRGQSISPLHELHSICHSSVSCVQPASSWERRRTLCMVRWKPRRQKRYQHLHISSVVCLKTMVRCPTSDP